ncbi:MAG TPA: cell division protein FtsQ/DivIB [Alphaproteobacteria bacterium]|nr:cell division protein FtsQ/DivIB [Alphaproteobacteria bacterium]
MPSMTAISGRLPRRQPKRLGLARILGTGAKLGALAGIGVVGFLAWRSGRLESALDWMETRAVDATASVGFRVEDVEVAGRVETDPKALLDALGLKRGDPLLAFDPATARERVEALPWVASAAVERLFPDTIRIVIVERRPIALWQHNERLSLIDSEGANLGPVALEKAPDLPLVVGGDAPAHAAELLQLLRHYPDLAKRVQASSWIGSRRWDLKLDNGVEVKLPESGVADALKQLADAEAASKLFERDVSQIDLRLPGKMVVRLAHAPAPDPKGKAKSQQGI